MSRPTHEQGTQRTPVQGPARPPGAIAGDYPRYVACGLLAAHHAWPVAECAPAAGPAAGDPPRRPRFLPDGGRPGGRTGREPGDRIPDIWRDGRSESGARAVASALAEVFPWTRHLSPTEQSCFAEELIAALSDAAELTIDRNAHEIIAGWRATARDQGRPGPVRASARHRPQVSRQQHLKHDAPGQPPAGRPPSPHLRRGVTARSPAPGSLSEPFEQVT